MRLSRSARCLLVLRRSRGPGFDANMPGFNLYGTDIVLSSNKVGRSAYVLPAYAEQKLFAPDGETMAAASAAQKYVSRKGRRDRFELQARFSTPSGAPRGCATGQERGIC